MRNKVITVGFRRKREGKTNYKKRINLLTGGTHRIVIRKSISGMLAQLVEFNISGDKVHGQVKSSDLKKIGWKYEPSNIPSAYLTGFALGHKIKGKTNSDLAIDIGRIKAVAGSRLFALVKGLRDAGTPVLVNEKVFPKEDRIKGKHIAKFAKMLNEREPKDYKKQFGSSIKRGADPLKIEEEFAKTKAKIGKN